MAQIWWIFLGGGLGALGRWWVSGWVATRVGETFPWGTLVVNVSGSMLAGFLAGLMLPEGRWWLPSEVRQFLMLGICGGYTTFSSFSLQTLHLMQEREWLAAVGNVGLSVVACLTAVWLGYTLALWLQTFRNG